MDEPQSCSNALPPFLLKTYEMIEDPSTDTIVSWSPTDKSFIVWNPPEFAKDLLPKFFKHNNFSSFIRQLNTYGFRKIDPEHWEFANEDFIRGSPQLLKNIHRRKPIHSHSAHNHQGLCAQNRLIESERQGLQIKIERLKNDKESLLIEIRKHEKESEDVILQLKSLRERLQESSQRQGNMESSLCQLLRPRLISSVLSQVDIHDRKRRLPLNDCRNDDTCEEYQSMVSSQARGGYMSNIQTILAPIIELQESLDSSLSFWENIIEEICDSFFNEQIFCLDESADDCRESPSISYVQLDIQSTSASIDMNCEPVSTSGQEPELTSSSKEESSVKPSFDAPVRFNDVFWEQFLTENPGSDGVQVAQSDRRDHSRKTKEGDIVDYRRMSWWGIRNVNNPSEQMGKLTPAGTT